MFDMVPSVARALYSDTMTRDADQIMIYSGLPDGYRREAAVIYYEAFAQKMEPIHAVFDFARKRGMRAVRLDVVDTNPDARRLYERLGFAPVRTRRCPYLFRRMGFSAFTTMVEEIA